MDIAPEKQSPAFGSSSTLAAARVRSNRIVRATPLDSHSDLRRTSALAPEVLLLGVRRLRLLALILVAMFASGAIALGIMRGVGTELPHWMDASALSMFLQRQHGLEFAGFALGAAMIGVTRIRSLSPERILAIGLIFQIAGALLFSASDCSIPWPKDQAAIGLPRATFWIMLFSLVPSDSRHSAAAAFGGAATGPLAFALNAAMGRNVLPVAAAVWFFLPLFASAAVTMFVSRLMYGFAVEASKARRLGSYSLVEKIAEGGMGEVWKARHASLIRLAAVKLIRPEYLGHKAADQMETILRRFEREAQATALLSSPHTVALYDFGRTHDGIIYYVMELLGGLDLEEVVRRFGPLPAERAVFILAQICHSLDDAHRVGLVHRDIKPANIQLTIRGGDFDFVKVLDFGLVKRKTAPGAAKTLQRRIIGTAAYMPPEAALVGEVDAQSDIYSLGCAAYFLLSGKLVFDGPNAQEMILANIRDKPVPVSRRTELPVPSELDELVLDMLAKNPSARPLGVGEVARRLAAIPSAQPWTQERAQRWWQTHLPDEVIAQRYAAAPTLGGTVEVAASAMSSRFDA